MRSAVIWKTIYSRCIPKISQGESMHFLEAWKFTTFKLHRFSHLGRQHAAIIVIKNESSKNCDFRRNFNFKCTRKTFYIFPTIVIYLRFCVDWEKLVFFLKQITAIIFLIEVPPCRVTLLITRMRHVLVTFKTCRYGLRITFVNFVDLLWNFYLLT